MKLDLMFDCDAVAQRLDDFQDGELRPCDRWMLQSHLWMCRTCRTSARRLSRLVDGLGELSATGEGLPDDRRDDLERLFRETQGGQHE